MSKFIQVAGYMGKINFDRDQIQSFSCTEMTNIKPNKYFVQIFYKYKETPGKFEFSTAECQRDFYNDLSRVVDDEYPLNWINSTLNYMKDLLLETSREIKKINKKLYNLEKSKK